MELGPIDQISITNPVPQPNQIVHQNNSVRADASSWWLLLEGQRNRPMVRRSKHVRVRPLVGSKMGLYSQRVDRALSQKLRRVR